MSNYEIVQSGFYVHCPVFKCVKKVYTSSIPDANLHRCSGCNDASGLNSCTRCSDTILGLLTNHSLIVTDSFQQVSDFGTLSNPIQLK